MDIDIKPIEKSSNGYRGVDRVLNTHHFKYKSKKEFDRLIGQYFDYISYTFDSECNDIIEILYKILPFYSLLLENGVSCEIIIWDNEPIIDEENIELLGIDIVNQHNESLLIDASVELPILNENMLFQHIDDCTNTIEAIKEHFLAKYGHEVKPLYIYRVVI